MGERRDGLAVAIRDLRGSREHREDRHGVAAAIGDVRGKRGRIEPDALRPVADGQRLADGILVLSMIEVLLLPSLVSKTRLLIALTAAP